MENLHNVILVLAATAAIGFLMWRQSARGGKWGIGALSAKCPRCKWSLPPVRRAASLSEMVWGGWTCPKCGCAVDKYGRERSSR